MLTYEQANYDGLLDWIKGIFHHEPPTIKDLPPDQQKKIHDMISKAQMKGILIGAAIGGIAVYFLLNAKKKEKTGVANQG